MKKISIVIPADDITAFYRVTRPYGAISRSNGEEFNITVNKTLEPYTLFQSDLVIFQRPFLKSHLENIKSCKHLGIPVMLDFDDDLLAVPETNPAAKIYNKETQDVIKECMALADHITVSTKPLADVCKAFNPNVTVVPNAYDSAVFKASQIDWTKRNKMVLWRGGSTHSMDISTCLKPLQELSREHSDWLFVFMGGEENFNNHVLKATMNGPNTLLMPTMPILKYAECLTHLSPAVSIVPLEFNAFNQSKSNIAWIESNAAGSAVVAPNMPEWVKPGISNYTTPGQFKAQVKGLLGNPSKIKTQCELSQDYIKTNLGLEKVNLLRIHLLKSLL